MKKVLVLSFLLITNFLFAQYNTLSHNGLDRTFLLHLPANYNPANNYPLVIAMHGGFGSGPQLENQSTLSEKADESDFIVVYPEGIQAGILNIRTWNAGWCCGQASEMDVDDVGFIDTLIDQLITNYSIDQNRIYATGMSNGGFMSYRLACELSDRIAAIAPVSATMSLDDCSPSKSVPIIHFHSYLDENVPYLGGIGSGISNHYNSPIDSVFQAWSDHNGCEVQNEIIIDNDMYQYKKSSNCDCKTEVQQYISEDGGHSWHGGNATLTGDPSSNYINANDLMWDFFMNHNLECTSATEEANSTAFEVSIYPNPGNDEIFLDFNAQGNNYTIRVINNLGKEVIRLQNMKGVNTSGLQTGLYYVIVEIAQLQKIKTLSIN